MTKIIMFHQSNIKLRPSCSLQTEMSEMRQMQ